MGRSLFVGLMVIALVGLGGCKGSKKPPYGVEPPMHLPGSTRQVWAVAPVINLSGQRDVDALLQADLLFQQLGNVQGVTPLPVNRVAEVYASLRIDKVQSEQQAALVCNLLGCDALVVASVSIYDPFNPPKFGAALQLFRRDGFQPMPSGVDPHELARRAAPPPGEPMPTSGRFVQVVGMYDAANGSVRSAVLEYAQGRHDPVGPLGAAEYMADMDRYCGFAYHALIAELLAKPQLQARQAQDNVAAP